MAVGVVVLGAAEIQTRGSGWVFSSREGRDPRVVNVVIAHTADAVHYRGPARIGGTDIRGGFPEGGPRGVECESWGVDRHGDGGILYSAVSFRDTNAPPTHRRKSRSVR